MSAPNTPSRIFYFQWTVVFPESAGIDRNLREGVVARFEALPREMAADVDLLLFAGDRELRLLGRASGGVVRQEGAGSGVRLQRVEWLPTPMAAARGWIAPASPAARAMVEFRGGNLAAEFRPIIDREADEAQALLSRILGPTPAANEEPPQQPAEKAAPSRPEPAAEGPRTTGVSAASLLDQPLSAAVRQILETSAVYAVRRGEIGELSGEDLLDGVLQVGNDDLRSSSSNEGAAAQLVRLLRTLKDDFVASRISAVERKPVPAELRAGEDAQSIFALARELARRTGRPENRIAGRHLVAALIEYFPAPGERSRVQRALAAGGVDLAAVRSALAQSLTERGPEAERTGWRDIFVLPASPADPRTWLPSFNADLASGEDKLGLDHDIQAMASLIASNSLQPPLSIGLFGDWGSGKSFFMRKLRERIRTISRREDTASRGVYWPNIVPVEFNAWHYVDANLWASLVSHVFAELRRWGADDSIPEKVKQEKDAALNRLRVASEARDLAQKRLDEAKRGLERAEAKHEEALGAARLNTHALTVELARNLWAEVQQRPELKEPLEQARAELRRSHLAVSGSIESVQEIHREIQQLRETGGRLRATGWTMLHGGTRQVPLLWLAGGTALALLLGWQGPWKLDFGPVASVVAQVATVVVAGAEWVTRSARRVSAMLEPLEQTRRKIEAAYQQVSDERDRVVAVLKGQVEASMARVSAATQTLAEAEKVVAAAQAAVNDATTARMISRFIEGRASSEDYRKHLGIVSTIREDFDQLSGLITAHNQALREASRAAESNVGDLASPIAAATTDLGINRIVLFIDDLDRCPPARVVEVLQAIHLLLAFPLFVVVVGVDSRWVEHSLSVQYPELLKADRAARGTGESSSPFRAAKPSDYLEKIFQIPYRVRPLTPGGCLSLIDALVVSDRVAPRPGPAAGAASQAAATTTAPAPAGGAVSADGTREKSPADPASGPQGPAGKAVVADAAGSRQRERIRQTLIESLRLTEPEIQVMQALSALIARSPRATKRFVNIYRLLKAAVPPEEQQAFVAGAYQVPMLLLAATTASPALARELAAALAEAGIKAEPFWKAVADFNAVRSDLALGHFVAAMRDGVHASRTFAALEINHWQARVAQFSFEEHRASV